jgi:hypothetical protein
MNILVEPYNTQANPANSLTTSTSKLSDETVSMPDFILTIQTFLTNTLARYPITTTVQP